MSTDMPGRLGALTSIRAISSQVRNYLEFIAAQTGVPIGWVSVGPERRQLISL